MRVLLAVLLVVGLVGCSSDRSLLTLKGPPLMVSGA